MSALNLDDFGSVVERPDSAFARAAGERRQRLVPPPGSLGRLEELADWLASVQGRCPTRQLDTVTAVLFAGDHGIAAHGVSARAPGGTARLVRSALDGEAPVNALARRFGARVRVVDMSVDCDPDDFPADVTRHRVRRSSGRIDSEDALTAEEAERAFRAGMAVADEEADSGTDLVVLGDLSVGGTTVAAVLVAALCGTDAAAATGRGSGIDDLTWMRKCAAVRDALRRARPVLGDQLELLAAVGGADFAAMTGFLLQCSVRRTPVLLDGLVSSAVALVAQRVAFRAPAWWLASQSTAEPAHARALDRLALDPLSDNSVRLGEAVGAMLALPLLQAAAALLAELPERPGLADLVEQGPDQASDVPSEEAPDGVSDRFSDGDPGPGGASGAVPGGTPGDPRDGNGEGRDGNGEERDGTAPEVSAPIPWDVSGEGEATAAPGGGDGRDDDGNGGTGGGSGAGAGAQSAPGAGKGRRTGSGSGPGAGPVPGSGADGGGGEGTRGP